MTKLDEKYERVLKYSEKEIDNIMKRFRKEKDNPPLPRHFPPISGRIKWIRSLQVSVEELAKNVSSHSVLKSLPQASEVLRKYNSATNIFKTYEEDIKKIWITQEVNKNKINSNFFFLF